MTSEDSPADHLGRSLELLWSTSDRSKPGPKPAFTLEQIVDAAIALADADGVDALSMRRVADELGTAAMSLYRYVPGKTELLNLMLDRVHTPTQELINASGGTWREVTKAHAWQSWRRYRAHPWLLQVNWSRPVLGPNMVADFDASLTALDGVGLDDVERVMIGSAVDGYVTGVARRYALSREASNESGISDQEYQDHLTPVLEAAVATGDYPAVAALPDLAFGVSWHRIFDFGLERLLDGLERFIDEEAPNRDRQLE